MNGRAVRMLAKTIHSSFSRRKDGAVTFHRDTLSRALDAQRGGAGLRPSDQGSGQLMLWEINILGPI